MTYQVMEYNSELLSLIEQTKAIDTSHNKLNTSGNVVWVYLQITIKTLSKQIIYINFAFQWITKTKDISNYS